MGLSKVNYLAPGNRVHNNLEMYQEEVAIQFLGMLNRRRENMEDLLKTMLKNHLLQYQLQMVTKLKLIGLKT